MDSSQSVPIDFSKPVDKTSIKGRTVLVTGGSSGIGAGLVKTFATLGAFVFIADLNEQDGQDLASDLTAKGLNVAFQQTDVTSYPSQLAAFKTCIQKSPRSTADIVIPCAGVRGGTLDKHAHAREFPPGSDPPEPPTLAIDVNLVGVYYTAHLACHYFSVAAQATPDEVEDKHLLFIASLAAYTPPRLSVTYSAAKFGVRGMWKSIRTSPTVFCPGMRTNLVAPSFVESPMTKNNLDMIRKNGFVIGDIEDVVQGMLRLCCDTSIKGRAMCIPPRKDSSCEFGSGSFDLYDNVADGDGSAALRDADNKKLLFGK